MQRELISEQNGSIVLYTTPEGDTQLEVKLEDETVWLTIEQMSQLFGRERSNISRHIHNIFKEGELEESLVCAKFAQPWFLINNEILYAEDGLKRIAHTDFNIWCR